MKVAWLAFLLFLLPITLRAQEEAVQFEQANQFYRAGSYEKARSLYEQILHNGYESAGLYYNLGNACFKLQDYPSAILNYERARRLAPHDEDVLYNLRLANLRVVDRIEPLPRLFFLDWWIALLELFSADAWAIVVIVALWCAAIGAGVVLLARTVALQRIGFLASILFVLVCVIAGVGSIRQYGIEHSTNTAIIFTSMVSVKSAPDAKSTDLFVLHEGVKVEFLDAVGDWRKIRLADGKLGWLMVTDVQII